MSQDKRLSVRSPQGTLTEPQSRSLLIAGYLEQLALPSMHNRELTRADYELWEKLLEYYPLAGIEHAFEFAVKKIKHWPKPAEIIAAVEDWIGGKVQCDEVPTREEIEQKRKEFRDWYKDSPEREAIRALDQKLMMGRPRKYSAEELTAHAKMVREQAARLKKG